MRSVKAQRKPVRGRKTERGTTRGVARSQGTFGKRTKKPSIFLRWKSSLLAKFSLRRPIVALSAVLLGLTLIAAIYASGIIGRTTRSVDNAIGTVMANAGFGIGELHISGNTRTPPRTILAALGLTPGQSIFAADLGAARQRLLQLDWIADADVQRRYPDAISVRIIEKLPFALWQSNDRLYLVERNGGIITGQEVEKFAHLPLLMGPGAPQPASDLVDAVAMHRAVHARTKAYVRQSERRWNLLLDNGVVVKLPETGWKKELDALERLIVDKGVLERDVVEIDLRSPSYFFFVLRGGEKKQIDRGSAA
jgi:cell division protein FtsQ